MPSFDLRGIKAAKYVNTSGVITYTSPTSVGDAMNVALELRYAEGRLYAEGTLAEYMRLAVGGTISIGVKYIPDEAQQLLFGATTNSRSINVSGSPKSITGLKYTAKDVPDYVGVAFYAPDKIDGDTKYSCVFIRKASFGVPAMSYQTKSDTIVFNTPTTTGEFLAEDSTNQVMIETGICDTVAEAEAWITAVLA